MLTPVCNHTGVSDKQRSTVGVAGLDRLAATQADDRVVSPDTDNPRLLALATR